MLSAIGKTKSRKRIFKSVSLESSQLTNPSSDQNSERSMESDKRSKRKLTRNKTDYDVPLSQSIAEDQIEESKKAESVQD